MKPKRPPRRGRGPEGATRPGRPSGERRRGGGGWIGIVVAFCLLLAGVVFWWGGLQPVALPPVPEVSVALLEPAVAAVIDTQSREVRESPRSGQAWGDLGMALFHYDFLAEAVLCFRTAEQLEPEDARWAYWLGRLLVRHDAVAAVAKLERSVSLAGARASAPRLQLALLLEELGRGEEAALHFEKLYRGDPHHTPALLGLARMDIEAGRWTEAAARLTECRRSPYTAQAAEGLIALVERRLGRGGASSGDGGRPRNPPLDSAWPDPFWAEAGQYLAGRNSWTERAELALDQGRAEEALSWIQRLTDDNAAAAHPWLLLARARMQQEDCPGGEQALLRHIQLAPESVSGHSELGVALLCQERYAEAAAALKRSLELKRDNGWAHFNLGFALARAGRPMEAIGAFRDAIRYSPDLLDPYITLADLLHQTGQTEEALAMLGDAERVGPDDERIEILRSRLR